MRKPCMVCLVAAGRSLPGNRLAPFRNPATRGQVNELAGLLEVLDADELRSIGYILEGFVERRLERGPAPARFPTEKKTLRPQLVISNS